eukprot:TRINITY_DN37524_c0_g1_i1.p2 TRINITY_DN37524_c0_g1~~TRINITY_DN37524_c0_g1_i1.p2  ORF type:complete len:297 (+),score=61.84 TRINITY_DN37524_c0_g1_i1:43-933(+)
MASSLVLRMSLSARGAAGGLTSKALPSALVVRRAPVALQRSFAASAATAAKPEVRLYQYEICPFCCKVKAFLDWQQVAYTTVEVNPLSKAELKFSKDYKKVPIALIDGEAVNDSTDILARLSVRIQGLNEDPLANEETKRWLTWADKELAVLLFPNITRNFGESYQAFKYISEVPTFSAGTKLTNQLAGSLAMWLANGKLKKKYNITDERKQLMDTLKVWTDAVGEGPFLKGGDINLEDVVVYGVISSIRGLATYDELMVASPALASWVNRVRGEIGNSMRVEERPQARSFGPMAP